MERGTAKLRDAAARARGLDGVRFSAQSPRLGIHALLEHTPSGLSPIVVRRARRANPPAEPQEITIRPSSPKPWAARAYQVLTAPVRLLQRLWSSLRRS